MRDTLITCLQEAADILMAHYGGDFDHGKKDRSFVTEVDVKAEKAITERIWERFPDHGIIGEEEGVRKGKEYTWVIDPIDGTVTYMNGLYEFGTLIAVLEDGEPVLAGMCLPALGLTYLAEKGKGATCNGERIRVMDADDLSDVLVSFGTDPKDEQQTLAEGKMYARLVQHAQYVIGANGPYHAATVADGRAGCVVNMYTKIWDIAAPKLILEEAGAVVTDAAGNPHDFDDPDTVFTFVAANPELHGKVVRLLRG